MNGFNRAQELTKIDSYIQDILKKKNFRREAILLLLSGLRTLGFKESLSCLQKESGIHLPSGFAEEFKEFVLQGRFDQALGKGN
jgi:hypothetical protein